MATKNKTANNKPAKETKPVKGFKVFIEAGYLKTCNEGYELTDEETATVYSETDARAAALATNGEIEPA